MQSLSIVVPCYRGESSLSELVGEIAPLTENQQSPGGQKWRVIEVILVFDGGAEALKKTIRNLGDQFAWIRPVWLSRNFGQHAATFAGLSQSTGPWVVTMDEDGQHNPRDIQQLLDVAIRVEKSLVYGKPINSPNHGWHRNLASRLAKQLASRMSGRTRASLFQSFRLIEGNLARSVAQTVGPNVYFDIALSWFVDKPATADVELRAGSARKSGYSFTKLLRHFWMLFLSIGTRTMRGVTVVGIIAAATGTGLAVFFSVQKLLGSDFPAGWASQITATLTLGGLILLSLGLIAEYLGSAVNKLMGKPAFFALQSERNNRFLQP